MATKRSQPGMPVGVGNQRITKRASYGNYGTQTDDIGDQAKGVLEPGRPESDRMPYQGEQRVPRSPARPIVRQWATPSYDPKTGRAARVGDDAYTKTLIEYRYEDVSTYHGKSRRDGPVSWEQVPDAGVNTTSSTDNRKGRVRPDRW